MNKSEFKAWMRDFKARFPSTGEWFENRGRDTIQVWFDDCFSMLELDFCLKVNKELLSDPEKIEGYNREKIPSVFLRRCGELRDRGSQDRRPSVDVHKRRRRRTSSSGTVDYSRGFDEPMKRAFNALADIREAYREEHGCGMPDVEWRAACDAYWIENPMPDGDIEDEPRYKCVQCRDSGYVSYRNENGEPMSGVCRCKAGEKIDTDWRNNRSVIGRAPIAIEVTP